MPRLRPFAAFFPLLATLAFATAGPVDLWVAAPDEGATVRDPWEAGARVLDRTPGAWIVADEASAEALRGAGWRVDGPIPTEGRGVFLFHVRDDRLPDLDAADLESSTGGQVAWTDGRAALLLSDGPLPEASRFGLAGKPLEERPIAPPAGLPTAIDAESIRENIFGDHILELADEVDSATYMGWIRNLSGADEVAIDGLPYVLNTRYTADAGCDSAERYVFERFVALGFDDVRFDPFEFDGIHARNVIATLPGVTRPDENIFLCAHLDDISPAPHVAAPGANDNASGVAAVLTAAEILGGRAFEKTIRFIAFTGEEQGLRGSAHYAAAAADSGMEIDAVVNCDMVAWYDDDYRVRVQGNWYVIPLMNVLKEAFDVASGLSTHLEYHSGGSDHVSFQNRGYAAVLAIEDEYWRYPCYHQFCDGAGQNDARFGVDVTRAVTAAIAYLAHPLPAPAPFATSVASAAPAAALALTATPNPFNPATTVRFQLPAAAETRIAVLDPAGRLVSLLVQERMNAGPHEIVWNGEDGRGAGVSSGVYFLRIDAGEMGATRKLTLVK